MKVVCGRLVYAAFAP
nr:MULTISPECIES: hypothetical protein [Vibrio]